MNRGGSPSAREDLRLDGRGTRGAATRGHAMDDWSAWTPGDMPEPQHPAPTWNAPSAPAGGPAAPADGPAAPASSSAGPGTYPSVPAGYASPSGYPGSSGNPAPPTGYPGSSGYPGSADYAGPSSYASSSGYPAPLGTPGPGGYPSPYGTPTGYPAQPYGTPGAAGHVPPPGQPYGAGYPPAGPYGAYPYGDPGRTESMATAAMIVGIAAFVAPVIAPIVAIVLGAVALNKIKRTGMRGRGQARAGIILGSAWLVLPIMAAIAIPVFLNQRNVALHDECANGNMSACDSLYKSTREGSTDHAFGDTCGGRTQGGYECTSIGAVSYGDDAHLDRLWDACAAGDAASCDELYTSAPPGSDYAAYGMTCGGRTDGSAECVVVFGQNPST